MFREAVYIFVVFFSHAMAEEYVYILGEVKNIPCIENPDSSLCNLDYKIPDFSQFDEAPPPNTTAINANINQILNAWSLAKQNVSDECKSGIISFQCASNFAVCQEDINTITIQGKKAIDACNKATKECAGLPNLSYFAPCYILVNQTSSKGAVCEAMPEIKDDPYPCSSGKYKEKYVVYPDQRGHIMDVLERHKFIQNSSLSESCKESAASVVCEVGFPACTKDKKKMVSFINKEDCHERLKCVTPDIFEALNGTADEICGSLPSGKNTTTRLSVSDAFGSDTSSARMIVGQLTMFLVLFITVLF